MRIGVSVVVVVLVVVVVVVVLVLVVVVVVVVVAVVVVQDIRSKISKCIRVLKESGVTDWADDNVYC